MNATDATFASRSALAAAAEHAWRAMCRHGSPSGFVLVDACDGSGGAFYGDNTRPDATGCARINLAGLRDVQSLAGVVRRLEYRLAPVARLSKRERRNAISYAHTLGRYAQDHARASEARHALLNDCVAVWVAGQWAYYLPAGGLTRDSDAAARAWVDAAAVAWAAV